MGLAAGLLSSLILIIISPSIMGTDGKHLINGKPLFPLDNPAILSIPIGFLGAWLGTLMTHEPSSADKWTELEVRANTGLGSEKALAH